MRRPGFLILILVLATSACTASQTDDLSIRVTGTPGTRVVGQYVLVSAAGLTRTSIDETVPFNFDLSGSDLSCYLQKLGQEGTVRLQLTINGQPIAFNSTRERFGTLSANTP